MGAVFVELLPLIVAAAVLPVWIIMALFLLRGEGGVRKATAFLVGATTVRLLQGALFGLVLDTGAGDADESNAIKATLLLVIGIIMLIAAYKKWRKEEDADAPPPKWMAALSGLSALKALGMGALLMLVAVKQWVFTLSALAIIEAGYLGLGANILLFVLFTLGAQLLIAAPIIVTVVAPRQAVRLLDRMQGFLERYNRPITIGVSLIFGLWFTWKGVTGLM